MRLFVLLALLLSSASGLACESELDNPGLSKLNLKQANGALNRTLLSIDATSPTSADNIASIDCYLEKQAVFFSRLNEIKVPLKSLGDAATSAQSLHGKRAATAKLNRLIARDAGTGFVQFPDSENTATSFNLFSELINTHCAAEATMACGQATDLAKKLWWIVGKYRSIADTLNQQDKTASLQFNDKLDQQWRSYKEDTIKLWPQEVLLNSLVYQPNSEGLSPPPSYKLLTLRPSIGLTYLSEQSHRVQPTINLDLLGIYWWRYEGAQAEPGRGVSASLIWDGDDTAYGVSYHHNPKWSATLAQGDENDVVVSISFQLAHWLLKR